MKRLVLILVAFFVPVVGVRGQTPLKPANGIYDPEGWLEENVIREMVGSIEAVRDKGGASVFVVILPNQEADGARQAALAMGRSWGGEGLWGLLLHVIDDPESPRCFGEFSPVPDWSEQQNRGFQASIQRALSNADRKAKLLANPRSQVASGTLTLSQELGYLGGVVKEKIEHNNAQARGDRGTEVAPKVESKNDTTFGAPSILVVVIGVLIVISFFAFFKLKKEEDREMEYLFPETSPRKRFLGPWSGGGNVLVQFNTNPSSKRAK